MSVSGAVLLLALAPTISFDVDWAAFRGPGDSSRVEFFYGVHYNQLEFHQEESLLVAPFAVSFEIKGLDSDFSQSGTIRKRATLHSRKEGVRTQRQFVDGFGVVVPPGRFVFQMTLAESARSGTVGDTITVPDFREGLVLSSLQTGSRLVTDSARGSWTVVPNPSRRFGTSGVPKVCLYLEVYNLIPDSGSFRVECALVKKGSNDTVLVTRPLEQPKAGRPLAGVVLAVPMDSVEPGTYLLSARVTETKSGRSAVREKEIEVGPVSAPEPIPYRLELTDLTRKYYREIQYLATPGELAEYRGLPDSGKEVFLAKFWANRNLNEFARRMETVQQKYGNARTPGVQTDRGRIYVKYGEPDEVEQKVMEVNTKPREYWHYYKQGLVFIFIDLRGTGDFRLAWTNSPDEPKTGLESYLTPQEQEEFH
ncbi:MAG: GWxTD domain-containing protein [candidate division WOR-3 bacterium]